MLAELCHIYNTYVDLEIEELDDTGDIVNNKPFDGLVVT